MFFNSPVDDVDALQKDWAVISGAVEALQVYLLSETLHWNLNSKEAGPVSLTPGLLLLSARRLDSARLNMPDRQRLEYLTRQWQAVRQAWAAAWQRKAQKECGERQRLLLMETEEWRDGPVRPDAFLQKIFYERVILELLNQELAEKFPPVTSTFLQAWDINFEQQTDESPLAWKHGTELAFPRKIFWFLYRTPFTRRK